LTCQTWPRNPGEEHPDRPDQHPNPAGPQALADIFDEIFCQMAGVPVREKPEEPKGNPESGLIDNG
jgi:hypothetical protein